MLTNVVTHESKIGDAPETMPFHKTHMSSHNRHCTISPQINVIHKCRETTNGLFICEG